MSDAQGNIDNTRNNESRYQEDSKLRARMERITRKIIILSGKGGVGKSTVSANLAVSLGMSGKKVGLLDIDLHGPSIPNILGLGDKKLTSGPDGEISPLKLTENLSVVSIGMLLDSKKDPVIWRGPMKYNAIRRFLTDVNWGPLDYLLIDSPPGTGDEPLSVAQLVGDGAMGVIVTTPQELAISDVHRSISFCKTLNLQVAGIIENMSGLTCPHCGEKIDLFKTGGGEKLAAEMGVGFLGRIPLDPDIVTSGDSGKAFVQTSADSTTTKTFTTVVEAILNHTVR